MIEQLTVETILNSLVVFGTILATHYRYMRSIDRMRDQIDTLIEEQKKYNNLQIRLTETEQRSKSNTHRIDNLENKVWQINGK